VLGGERRLWHSSLNFRPSSSGTAGRVDALWTRTLDHSLYDALVSINVPTDKARAVVDAMERDMGTALATKSDLQLIRQDMENRFNLVSRDIESLRQSTQRDLQSPRDSTARDLGAFATSMAKDLEALRLTMTVRLGSMLVVGFGLMLAATRL